jgi:hypothetical protein
MFDRKKINKIIREFYEANKLDPLKNDYEYLEKSFKGINLLWLCNYRKIKEVKYLMIAEAPLWGTDEKYIYNPKTENSQFFYRNDLGEILNKEITTKSEFIDTCNQIGLLIVDISPYPLNQKDTVINYRRTENGSRRLTTKEYRYLVQRTIDSYFRVKIELIKRKKSDNVKVFFRYSRVKDSFTDIVSSILEENKLLQSPNDLMDISQNGGGISKLKLCKILNTYCTMTKNSTNA